jgi:hypothetical protein
LTNSYSLIIEFPFSIRKLYPFSFSLSINFEQSKSLSLISFNIFNLFWTNFFQFSIFVFKLFGIDLKNEIFSVK